MRRSPELDVEAEARRSADPVDGVRADPLLADEARRSPSEARVEVVVDRRAESGRDVLAVADDDARGMRSVWPG